MCIFGEKDSKHTRFQQKIISGRSIIKSNVTVELADCKYFTTNLLDLDTIMVRNFSELDSFVVYICMAGKASIRDNKGNEIFVHQGQTVLIPADTEVITISPAPGAKFMETYIGQ